MTVIGDILVVGTMKRIHFTNKDYAKRHHGGYLGSKSRELKQERITNQYIVMRKVFGIGETILDIIFRNDQPQKAVPGGSVFNGLISLGRLNVPVSFISELGNDRVGDMIRDFMEDNHITTEFVDRFPDGKSPISLAFLDDDKNANYIFYKGGLPGATAGGAPA